MKRASAVGIVAVALVLHLVAVNPACAQTSFTLMAGTNAGSGHTSFFESVDPGLALQASLGHPVGSHLSARLDASLSRISAAHHFGACTPGGFCYPSFTASLGVAGVGASGLVDLDFTPGMYLIAGAGTSYFYENPLAQGALRLNFSLGAGVAVPTAPGWPQFVAEMRYVRLVDAPSAPTWVLPLTVGLRF